MNQFENEIRRALGRREPPAGFAERVVARLPAAEPKRRWIPEWLTLNRWSPAFAVVLMLVLLAGGWEYRRAEERREGERSKQELIFALQLTSHKLQTTKTKLLENLGGSL
jgi:hypothetical protein